VHSIKVLREVDINQSMNEPLPTPPSDFLSISLPENQGEYQLPEGRLDEDSLQEKIQQHRMGEDERKEEYGADARARKILQERRITRDAKRKAEFQVGDKVKIKTWRFGREYAKEVMYFDRIEPHSTTNTILRAINNE
jgi:hypothetical protein